MKEFLFMSTFLIVGLGNPGSAYATTRHNLGAMVLEELATRTTPMPATFSVHKRSNAAIAESRLGGHKVILAQPRSFMNLSGGPVKALADFFKVSPTQTIVLFDDLELALGQIKITPGGGDHGHNGLRSITKALGKNYVRAGVGIGRPPGRQDVASFVLKPFAKAELAELPIMCTDAADEIENYLSTIS
ncbi:aminoacyl-tRNA hydrolase [Corynebacterium kutscheri]|uniref:Peptidyl-tRNA hydrolase n=2 Tax=Corynebacterium kutscheri TaxID=35755 RepID=A0A0F6TDP4_9CORY|nr:aminoacyl-tRNA hydrolase [Corynebacterium kutscheri]VEH10130.1 Peptidyl-tRNA hydrolase 1 [Corynebacterium kutscheri]